MSIEIFTTENFALLPACEAQEELVDQIQSEMIENHVTRLMKGKCDPAVRAKIYAYIAMCGLLWSNWCEFKRALGVEFGEYALRQYRYAKDYYNYAKELMEEATR